MRRIPIDALTERARLRGSAIDAVTQWLASGRACVPSPDGRCSRCEAPWSEARVHPVERDAVLYGCTQTLSVTVYARHCHCDGSVKEYDGLEDGVFRYSNKVLWLHEVMLAYVDLMVESRMPFNAYYNVLKRQYARRGESICSKTTVTASLKAFIRSVDVDFHGLFSCPTCETLATEDQVYIIDGKAMGFRRDLMGDRPLPPASSERARIVNGTTFAYIGGDRPTQNLAKMVRDYALGEEVEFVKMKRQTETKAPELTRVLDYIRATHPTSFQPCPQRYSQLLYDIATPCPISCLIPKTLHDKIGGAESVLDRILDAPAITQTDRARLQEWGSLSTALAQLSSVPAAFKPLLRKLLELARLPGGYTQDASSAARGGASALPDVDEMSYFPNHPRIRCVRSFENDTCSAPSCTKIIKKSPTFTPGMFSVFCPHGICIGFQAMRDFESARVPFTLFYERFQAAPGIIVYDNACNASRFCIRREPLFFAKVRFLIDRVHQSNHILCHSGYTMDACPPSTKILNGTMTLGLLNSQAAEQAHAKMKLIETQTSFMGQDTFMDYCKLFMALKNQTILKNFN